MGLCFLACALKVHLSRVPDIWEQYGVAIERAGWDLLLGIHLLLEDSTQYKIIIIMLGG